MLEPKDLEMITEIVEKVINPIKDDVGTLKSNMRALELTLENEKEILMLKLRVNRLESELEKVKAKLEEIA